MALSDAERQRRYRDKRVAGRGGERRINLFVGESAWHALNRLAKHYGVTKRAMLERVIEAEDERVSDALPEPELEDYYLLRSNDR
ncbi:RepB family protein [Methylohalobius crimeensis]|uniref:RepB family protein n=1 Tax=Methylohalobius crimeensis TaxID=244365 RepID=UPI0003F82C93|nr:RepB family protein [Methylohalobius crimeensis]